MLQSFIFTFYFTEDETEKKSRKELKKTRAEYKNCNKTTNLKICIGRNGKLESLFRFVLNTDFWNLAYKIKFKCYQRIVTEKFKIENCEMR